MRKAFIAVLAIVACGCGINWLGEPDLQRMIEAEFLYTFRDQMSLAEAIGGQLAIRTAINIYWGEEGHWPYSLEGLAPEYLTHVPLKADGTPYNYDPETGRILDDLVPTTLQESTADPQAAAMAADVMKLAQIQAAIGSYTLATGHYPASLYTLVPQYLPDVPKTSAGLDFVYYPQHGIVFHPSVVQQPPSGS